MDYAFLLCFDPQTEAQFQKLIDAIAQSGVSSYMIDESIPPHVSIACFTAQDIQPVIQALDGQIGAFPAGDLVWPSLGMFVPQVLFAAPVLNQYLLKACTDINQLIAPFSTVGEDGFYRPYQWMPHTTLALELDADGLRKAADIAVGQFSMITGKTNRLTLVAYKSTPFQEIKTWNLG